MASTARSFTTDPFQNFRYVVYVSSGGNLPGPSVEAGFNSVTLPEHNIESIEYSEGTMTYSRHYPGRSNFGTITLSKGLYLKYSYFERWIRKVSEGFNYRTDLEIHQFHRSDLSDVGHNIHTATASRKIKCFNVVPVRFNPGGTLDASSGDVTLSELEVSCERFYVYSNGEEIKPGG